MKAASDEEWEAFRTELEQASEDVQQAFGDFQALWKTLALRISPLQIVLVRAAFDSNQNDIMWAWQEPSAKGGDCYARSSSFIFLIAIAAAFFGFSGIAGTASFIAWVLLAIFAVLFVLSLIVHLVRGGSHHRHI
jgi:uncharacterized membrane protein YtjA (UPF0391 family)